MFRKTLAVLLTALLLSGCATSGLGTDGACSVFAPIWISKEDVLTDLTARQILIHNETGAAVCGW